MWFLLIYKQYFKNTVWTKQNMTEGGQFVTSR